jgi:hypothetical protein
MSADSGQQIEHVTLTAGITIRYGRPLVQTIAESSALACKTLESRRFAELAARTGLEPDLAQRYATDPVAVLAEFGLSAAEPLYFDDFVTAETAILIENLGLDDSQLQVRFTLTWTPGQG